MPAPTHPNIAPNMSNAETHPTGPPPNMPPPHPLDATAHYPPPSFRYPPPSYYDPYYDMRYDPYYPPPSHGPPPNAPPPRYSPEYRANHHRYAYPPPPPPSRASPRSMAMGMAPYPPKPGPPTGALPYAPRPDPPMYRGPPPRLRNVRPSPIQTRESGDNGGGVANRGEAQHTPTHVPEASSGTPIVSRGPSPDGSKGTVASTGTGTALSSAAAGEKGLSAVDGGGKERGTDKTPDGKNHAEFMVNAVDNIIAAAEQIEKRDSPPNCPLESKLTAAPANNAAPENNANATNNKVSEIGNDPSTALNPPPSVAVAADPAMADPSSSPPPPSFHRYSTSPVVHHNPPPPAHGMLPPPPNHAMPPPPLNHNYTHYDPYYDYGRPPYDYYDSHYYPPPPPNPYDHPPHCTCNYCSPTKRRHPQYPPPQPYWDRDYQDYALSLSSPETHSSSQPPHKKRKHNDTTKRMYHTYSNATKHKSTTARRLTPQEEEEETNRVIRLAAEVEQDSNLYRAVLLHMALEKESPKKKPSFDVEEVLEGFAEPSGGGSMGGSPNSLEGFGGSSPHGFGVVERGVIGEGFYWKDYPLLENVLRKSMDEYYEMSENCPQSKQQQQFNNRLVSKVYHVAIAHGYTFDPVAFTGGSTPLTERKKTKTKEPKQDYEPLPPGFNYKKLRDRIRCYYKTHVQNSKKRLTTMLKNPTKPKNREILLRVVAEVKSEGYVGPISNWDGPKTKKQKSKVTPSVTFSSDDDFGLGSFSADSNSPTESGRVLVESTQVAASPFRRMEHAQILSSMRDGVSL